MTQPKNILVLDDGSERLDWFRIALDGHNVDLANSAAEALRHLRETTYDLVFFDHDLGEDLDGSNIASEVLWNADTYKVPLGVLVHSANPVGAENIASKFRSAGVPVAAVDFTILQTTAPNTVDYVLDRLSR